MRPRELGGPGMGAGKKHSGVWGFVKSLYQDDFRWNLVKSCGMFAFGVFLAKELKGLDLSAAAAPPGPPA